MKITFIVYCIGYCLSAGTYKFTINDKFKDGMDAGTGGSYAGYVAGTKKFGSPSSESDWGQRVHEFTISTNSAEQFTAKMDTTDTDEQWLIAHNSRRKEWHTRYGKTYVPLNWSNALKAQAKAYAQELLSTCGGDLVHGEILHTMPCAHSPESFFRIILTSTMLRLNHSDHGLDNTVYGENMASNLGSGSWGKSREPEDILIRWVEKEADVGWPKNAHLTQALWRATTHVGCDAASKSWKDGMCHVQVCRYARPGMFCLPNLQPPESFDI
jgi:hypothetical protein